MSLPLTSDSGEEVRSVDADADENRSFLHDRIGTHAEFLERMRRKLSAQTLEDRPPSQRPLAGLTARETTDPTIALMDAWAMVCDVLTFYQRRIANEGYLQTATQSFSIQQLVRAIDYELGPGVAAQVDLELVVNQDEEGAGAFTVPAGTQVQSVPGQDEQPQMFETSESITVRAQWNELRAARDTTIEHRDKSGLPIGPAELSDLRLDDGSLSVLGRHPRIKPGDSLLVVDQPVDQENESEQESDQSDVLSLWAVLTIDRSHHDPDRDVTTFTWKEPGGISLANAYRALASPAGFKNPAVFHLRSRLALFGYNAAPWEDVSDEVKARLYPRFAIARCNSSTEPSLDDQTRWEKIPCTGLPPIDVRGLSLRHFGKTLELFAATSRGLFQTTYRYEEPPRPDATLQWKRISSSLPNEDVHCCAVDPEGTLFAGTSQGIVYFSEDDGRSWQSVAPVTTTHSFDVTVVDSSKNPPEQTTEPRSVPIPLGAGPVTAMNIESAQVASIDADGVSSERTEIMTLTIERSEGRFQTIARHKDPKQARRGLGGVWKSGGTAPKDARLCHNGEGEWFAGVRFDGFGLSQWPEWQLDDSVNAMELSLDLDAKLPNLLPDSWIVLLDQSGSDGRGYCLPLPIDRVAIKKHTQFELAGEITRVIARLGTEHPNLGVFDRRQTQVLGESRRLELHRAEEDSADKDRDTPAASQAVTLDRKTTGLRVGQRVAVRGRLRGGLLKDAERCEIGTIESIENGRIVLRDMTLAYDPDTVRINANVVRATHGETVTTEVLGSGDATAEFQHFVLSQSPLTYARDSARQLRSSLQVRVNDAVWDEVSKLYGQPANRRCYIVRQDDHGRSHVIFGDGRHGSRLPTGNENVVATYRLGTGTAGQVRTGQLSLLPAAPLGIDSVTNPKPAWGGRDPETSEMARQLAPKRLSDRQGVVGLRDYESFALAFGGICKARATRDFSRQTTTIRLDVAGRSQVANGSESASLVSAELCTQLQEALLRRQPQQEVQVISCRAVRFGVHAVLEIDTRNYRSKKVISAASRKLAENFLWSKREFGQVVAPCEVTHALQRTPGVIAVHSLHLRQAEESETSRGQEWDRENLFLINPADIELDVLER